LNKLKIFSFIILLVLLSSLYVNYNVYRSFIIQKGILYDFNNNRFNELVFEKFKRLNIDFPNVGVTALPLKELLARYYNFFGEETKALELFNTKQSINPNWHVNEFFKAELFLKLKVRDSAYYYSKKAFEALPGNIAHYEIYIKVLSRENKLDEIISAYNNARRKRIDHDRLFFLYTYNLTKSEENKVFMDSILKVKRKVKNDELQQYIDFHLYGREEALEAFEHIKKADSLFKSKSYEDAKIYYRKALKINPDLIAALENILIISVITNQLDKDLVEQANNLISFKEEYEKIDGKEYFLKASILRLIDAEKNQETICNLLDKSKDLNYKPAIKFSIEFCN